MKGEKHSVTTPSPIGSAIPSPVGWHNIHRRNIYRTLVRDYRSCSGASKKCRSNVGSCRLIGLCFLLICLSLITGGRADPFATCTMCKTGACIKKLAAWTRSGGRHMHIIFLLRSYSMPFRNFNLSNNPLI